MVKSEKDLGVMIANDTSWKEHIVTNFTKANRMLGFLRDIALVWSTVKLFCIFTPYYYAPIYAIVRKFGPLSPL